MRYEQPGREDIGFALWQAITRQEDAEQCPPSYPFNTSNRSVASVGWGTGWLLAKMTRLTGRRNLRTINSKGAS